MKEILEELLEFGVNENIEDSPVDHTQINHVQKSPSVAIQNQNQENLLNKVKQHSKSNMTQLISPAATAEKTLQMANECESLQDLESVVRNFKDLSITKTATNVVFSDGNPKSDIMIIGEAPGADEDANGIPFCGASGKLLDHIFSYIDLSREKNIYITNTLFWRPPGNRRPTPEELKICKPFVEKHIALINPKLIILVGGTAVSAILDTKQTITKIRGSYHDYQNQFLNNPIKTTAVFHPSYLLRSPGQKKKMWLDCLHLREYLQGNKIAV